MTRPTSLSTILPIPGRGLSAGETVDADRHADIAARQRGGEASSDTVSTCSREFHLLPGAPRPIGTVSRACGRRSAGQGAPNQGL